MARPATWLALLALGVSLAMIGSVLLSMMLPGFALLPDRPDLVTFVVVLIAFVTLPTVGAILAILRPGNPIGWLFLITGLGFISSVFAAEYVSRSVVLGALPLAELVDWVSAWATTLALAAAAVFVPLLFPDGHLPGPRWRPFAWAALIAMAVTLVAQAIEPNGPAGSGDPTGYGGQLTNPFGVDGPLGAVATLVADTPLLLIFVLGALASLGLRFRRSQGVERQQLKWFLFAVAVLTAALIVGLLTPIPQVWYVVILGLSLLPVAAAFAVLRYRLYEIDRIISRTIAYGAVTVTLALVFVAGVLGLQTILAPVTRDDTIAVAASTLVVAALFQPLRRRVQVVVDRRFDRVRYDGERLIDAFGQRLRDEVDVDRLRGDLVTTTEAAVRPSGVGIWIHDPPASMR